MVTKKQLIAAGAGSNVEILGYWRARLTAPDEVAGQIREYAYVKTPDETTDPELYILDQSAEAARCVEKGVPAWIAFRKVVEASTVQESGLL